MLFCAELVLDVLYSQHKRELIKFASQQANEEIAPDLVQEAFLRLARQSKAGHLENPRAYLYKIVKNLSTDYARQNKTRLRYQEEDEPALEQIADIRPVPEINLEQQAKLACCLDALNELPEIQRHVFLLHRIDGLTYPEISRALNIPTRTVERYAAKALAHCFAKVQDKF